MRHRAQWGLGALLGALLGVGLACEIDGSIGRDGPSGTGDGTGATAGSTEPSTGDSGDDPSGADDATSVGSAEGGGTGSPGTTEGPTDHPPVCHPTPDDEACARCRKTACCPLYEACLAHDGCLCWWECAATDHTHEECQQSCDNDGALFTELEVCVQAHCDTCPPTDAG